MKVLGVNIGVATGEGESEGDLDASEALQTKKLALRRSKPLGLLRIECFVLVVGGVMGGGWCVE